jgi:hypothetical protein
MATLREDYWLIEQEPPAFYRSKKIPMSSNWAFQLSRRHESRSQYRYRTREEDSDDAYGWVALIVLLSFSAGSLLSAIVMRFI